MVYLLLALLLVPHEVVHAPVMWIEVAPPHVADGMLADSIPMRRLNGMSGLVQ
jgi:hypothetical protein